jgi:hypothetical protein
MINKKFKHIKVKIVLDFNLIYDEEEDNNTTSSNNEYIE